MTDSRRWYERGSDWLETAINGVGFAGFVLSFLAALMALMAVTLVIPAGGSAMAAFAEEFRVWCFGYNPDTGTFKWGYLFATFGSPIILGIGVVWIWGRELWQGLRQRRRSLGVGVSAGLLIACGFGGALYGSFEPSQPMPFPAEALRTKLEPPDFDLTNQNFDRVRLSDFRGKVVLMTAVYATCGFTCPMILAQLKRALASVPESKLNGLRVVGVTLDPEHDTPEVLARLAKGQQVEAPLVNLVTGDSKVVNVVLDKLGVSRRRNEETGVIDHANLFILVDRAGRVAFRFTLGDLQEAWLKEAIDLLLSEEAGAAPVNGSTSPS